jgi:hypothetical protein
MADYRLMNVQKANIADIIDLEALNIRDFGWRTRDSGGDTINLLVHEPSGYFAEFDRVSGKWHLRVSPGANVRVEVARCDHSFDSVSPVLRRWIRTLRDEIETPDPWQMASAPLVEVAEIVDADGSTAFSDEEREEVRERLLRVRGRVRELAAGTPHEQFVEERLDQIAAAIDHQNKQAWWLMAIGGMWTIISALSLSNTDGQALINLLIQGVHHLPS